MNLKSEQLIDIVESVNAIIWEYNIIDDNWDYISPQSKRILGYSSDEWKGLDFWIGHIYYEDREWAKNYCLKCTREAKDHIFEYRFIKKNGEIIWLRDEVVIVMENKKPVKLRGFMTEITELKEREERIKYLLYRDRLTDVYNRRYYEKEMKRLDTQKQLPLSIIMADLNGLKLINDSYGHKKGDELLVRTAKILKKFIGEKDVLARQGGDEFAMLLPKTTKKEAEKLLIKIKNEIKKHENENPPISIALGLAEKKEFKQDIEEVLKKADNKMYNNKLSESRSSKSKIVEALLNVLDAKSHETKEHAVRLTKMTFDFGEKLGLSNSDLNKLSLLSTLHDIGKTNIDKKILNKPGKLSKKEWETVKNHPELGYKIASASEEFIIVAEEIFAHHERWDGTGYPRKLKGDEIPYLARILSIIDAYDVMTNERSYSKAISRKEALKEIEDCAGSQFDPKLAKKFIELMNL